MFGRAVAATSLFLSLLMLSSATGGGVVGAAEWSAGSEEEYVGHTFDEEMWTNDDVSFEGEGGGTASFTASYVNTDDVQAFLVAFNGIEKDNRTGTLPYQMFGMHYFTPQGNEVFLGALLASLVVYNDTNGNGYPDPGDGEGKLLYVFPFGVDNEIDPGHAPTVSAIPVTKLGEGRYSFGIRYEDLYAFVSPAPLLGALLRTGWIAEFSEFTVTYELTLDEEDGTFTAETFYTIGQVTDLWTFILGIPIHTPDLVLSPSLGLGVLHYVTIFTSRYNATDEQGHAISSASDAIEAGTVDIGVGEMNERAFRIGLRGEYDLIDESGNGTVVSKDQKAYNVLLQARPVDLLLVGWQLAFSAGLFSVIAYGLSDYIQEEYADPWDLANRSLRPLNPGGFGVQALWYAVGFPSWQGYRVVHDPVYTAYVSVENGEGEETSKSKTPGFESALVLFGLGAAALIAVVSRRYLD